MDNILKPISEIFFYNKCIDKRCILAINGCDAFFINKCLLREDKNVEIKFSKPDLISSKWPEKFELILNDKKYFGEISIKFTDNSGIMSHLIELNNYKISNWSLVNDGYELSVNFSSLTIFVI